MKKDEFIKLIWEYFSNTSWQDEYANIQHYNSYFSVGDEENENTSIYIDKDNYIWIRNIESVVRVKTSIKVDDIMEIRYSEFGCEGGRFFVICQDYSGLDFCEGEIGYFKDGYYGAFENAVDWFKNHPVP